MKIIIDTNVLVSAVLKGKQPRAVIQFVLDDPDCEWIVSEEILTEYKQVLSRSKFNLTSQICSEWFEILDNLTTLIEVNVEIDFPQDRKDAKFLACAVAAQANFLITGDSDFNSDQSLVKTAIISVSLFKKLVCDVK